MLRKTFLKRMAFAAAACAFFDLPTWEPAVDHSVFADKHPIVGIRDSLQDIIPEIHPVDTPFITAIKAGHPPVELSWTSDCLLPEGAQCVTEIRT